MFNKSNFCAALALLMGSSGLYAQTPAPSGPAVLEEVVVTGVRASEQQSVELKRDAASIQDSIAAEDIGKLPDRTIADSLQRITGVQSIELGDGHARGHSVRQELSRAPRAPLRDPHRTHHRRGYFPPPSRPRSPSAPGAFRPAR